MNRKTRLIILILVAPLALWLAYLFGGMSVIGMVAFDALRAKSRKVNLLYQTDHKALLKACRTLLEEGYKGKYCIRVDPHPDVDKFPKAILNLKPTYVLVHGDNYVGIEMMGGMSHFGVLAYPGNFVPPFEGFCYGDKKLMEGLWYYDDGYKKDPNYEKKIESLRPKDK
jgi:hypothetical protein